MSYLGWPRLHFSGRFQADTSTVNNDVRHYKNDAFEPQFQAPMVDLGSGQNQRTNGYWNPEGTAAWRMLGCKVTGATLPGGSITSTEEDPVIGWGLAGSNDRVAGKLVDLDPQQQAVSEIWGLSIALDDLQGNRLLDSHFMVAAFIDLWKRQQLAENFDQTLVAAYQSQLRIEKWGDISASPVLIQLKETASDGLLSIRFNVFGYDRSPEAKDYTTGRVVGTIGPATASEPKHFVLGRQLVAVPSQNPTVPRDRVYNFQCLYHPEQQVLSADVGNSLPVYTAAGDFEDIGCLYLAISHNPDVTQSGLVNEDDVTMLGKIKYQSSNWYEQTAGIVDFDCSELTVDIDTLPLVLLKKTPRGDYEILIRETQNGLFARADQYVYRLNPGEQATVDFYSTCYGRPSEATLDLKANNDLLGGAGTSASLNEQTWPVPDVGQPASALTYRVSLSIGATGHAPLTLAAEPAGPGTPRGYLDGQVYGIGYTLRDAPKGYQYSIWNFVSVLLWDAWPIPDTPTWHRDIQPILEQYGNLYPIMSRHLVNLGDYDSVVKHLKPLELSFALPVSDPNSMPVSRDLSANKRAGILKWLRNLDDSGLPLKGEPADRPAAAEPAWVKAPAEEDVPLAADPGGKLDFIMRALAAGRATDGDSQQENGSC